MKIMPRNYVHIDFPPLTEEQKQEMETLMAMRDEDIDTRDIPVCDFSDAQPYYTLNTICAKMPHGEDAAYVDEIAVRESRAQEAASEVCFA